ncbi:MAG: TetR/AcrR family bet gene transcriptional repressor [Bradymonadia bacterium]|jgi:TetR/AcrR family transcriptional repressor of bet genes
MLILMAERGFDAASIAAIAKQARLAPGLVHYHFGNKQEILEAAVASLVAVHERQVETALRGELEPADYLDRFVALHLELKDGFPAPNLALWQVVLAEAARRPSIAAIVTLGENRWRDRLAARFLELKHPVPHAASAGILAIVRGYLALAATSPSLVPTGSAIVVARTALNALIQEGRL